ncbi:SEC-C domain-containing protein [Patescibacteria group bacterium]|nr:SEC-C domain-containing protein [Patescibacteria group bacterium]
MGKVKKYDPCRCGSGRKYKDCCYPKVYKETLPNKKMASFTLDNGTKISKLITSINSIPRHNLNALTPDITSEQMLDLCLDEIYKIISREEVGMLIDLVDKVIQEMDIKPTFTYKQISERMETDGRFEIYQSQICSLKGTDPVELIAKKLKI